MTVFKWISELFMHTFLIVSFINHRLCINPYFSGGNGFGFLYEFGQGQAIPRWIPYIVFFALDSKSGFSLRTSH